LAVGVPVLLPLMVAVPYVFKQNEQPGLLSVLVLSCIVAYTALKLRQPSGIATTCRVITRHKPTFM
jgi:hypothetical protein